VGGRVRRQFRRRIAALALALAILPTVAVGWALIGVNQAALTDLNRELLIAVIDDVAQQIERTFDEASTSLTAIGRTLSDEAVQTGAGVAAARALISASPAITAVGFYDERGARIDAARDAGDTTALPDRLDPALGARAAVGRAAVAGAAAAPGGAVIPVITAVVAGAERWVLYAPVSLASVEERVAVIASRTFEHDPEAVLVVDRALRVVASADPEARARAARTAAGVVRDLPALPTTDFFAFGTHPSAPHDPRGPLVGAVRNLPALQLAVIAQLPVARAYASLSRMRWIVGGAVAATALLAAVVALALARRLGAPVGQLVAYAGELAQRRFDAPLAVRGRDELALVGDAMREAARSLAASEQQLRDEAAVRADLGRYLPAQLVDKIVRREQSLALGGELRRVTVLFADVAGFSTLVGERPPPVVVAILNQLFTILSELVFRHGGTVDKFIGDCVMAFWNAPDAQADHGARAVAAAADMARWVEAANEIWQDQHGVTVHLAIGIHTGDAVIGNFGSERRMEYTCIGEAVSLAARLEAIARPSQILVTEAVRDAAGDRFTYLPLGQHRVARRLEPVELFEVIP
jgi:class 3 adenylate cyclase